MKFLLHARLAVVDILDVKFHLGDLTLRPNIFEGHGFFDVGDCIIELGDPSLTGTSFDVGSGLDFVEEIEMQVQIFVAPLFCLATDV